MSNSQKLSLTITYRWNSDKQNGIDLALLGESIAGFDHVLRELIKVARIEGNLEIGVEANHKGSIILDIALKLLSDIPFHTWHDIYNFLAFIGNQEMLGKAKEIGALHGNINQFFSQYPFDSLLLATYIPKIFEWAKRQKTVPTAQDVAGGKIPSEYAVRLHKITKKRVYRKALKPFIEGQSSEVIIASKEDPKLQSVIDNSNFDTLLSEKEQILPDYENDKAYSFPGQIVGLEGNTGEHIKFKVANFKRPHNVLVAYPEHEKTTLNYVDYYKKDVLINAQVQRISMYQKPKLLILEIRLLQEPLDL
jgi:hypothetical protein